MSYRLEWNRLSANALVSCVFFSLLLLLLFCCCCCLFFVFHTAIILVQRFFSDSSFLVVPSQIGIEPKMQAGLKAYRMCKWFHLLALFVCPINFYEKENKKGTCFCFEFELLRAQPCWLAFHPMKNRKRLFDGVF